jgi:hypothetical protein
MMISRSFRRDVGVTRVFLTGFAAGIFSYQTLHQLISGYVHPELSSPDSGTSDLATDFFRGFGSKYRSC